jgi:Oligosaccharyltransferase subunit 5
MSQSVLLPFSPPVSPSLFPALAAVLLLVGFIVTALLAVRSPQAKAGMGGFITDILYSAVASVLLGFGGLFLFLWAGVSV